MSDQKPNDRDPYGPRKHVYHEGTVTRGEDVYPPELIAAARKNWVPGEFDEEDGPRSVFQDLPLTEGAIIYPPELFAERMKAAEERKKARGQQPPPS